MLTSALARISAAAVATVPLLAVQNTHAILIRHDALITVDGDEFHGLDASGKYAEQFDAVVAIEGTPGQGFDFYASGVLIAPNLVLTARHSGVESLEAIRFGSNHDDPDYEAVVDDVVFIGGPRPPGGDSRDGSDVAVVRLTDDVPAHIATPIRPTVETDTLVGKTASLVGYGLSGVGTVGHNYVGPDTDPFRRAGTTVIDAYGPALDASGNDIGNTDMTFSADFDNGDSANNVLPGSEDPTEFEATVAPGDSGGPLLVRDFSGEWLVAGVVTTGGNGRYGSIGYWTSLAQHATKFEDDAEVPLVLIGDFNGDGFVSQPDLDLIITPGNWGATQLPSGFVEWNLAFGMFDGLISQNELDMVTKNWADGTLPVITAVPEPSSLVLVALTLLHRRPRGCTLSPYTA